ncbi:hypothetical protein MJO55_28870 (plasmid) [Mycolicibacterium rufum]|uniref:Uncharacterized protein n=1 Tax=Mycolicibacterium rufum TaxID=318424 RepID=A0A9X2YDF9_9MYCO|nr:hypothetical protein [Mycolicibacterium rufum]KGI66088.1 hypothetical protein EU78_28585 [Mycolicibacterium rufum]MCV7071999.1 hypothetical protein [Mycolicibacterium rufum]ULP39931.1 hypothetical protein MJO55_28870 [Mycolicibacterium rufum]
MARERREQMGVQSAQDPPARPAPSPSQLSEVALTRGWERDEDLVAASLADVVSGLNVIAGEAIHFARLPRKWGRHATRVQRWADIADESLGSLLALPGIGESAVRALITTARESVRAARTSPNAEEISAADAVEALLSRLDDFDRTVLAGRQWTWHPTPTRLLAPTLGCSEASISRNTPRARQRFAELVDDPAHRAVTQHASHLRQRLGIYTTLADAQDALTSMGVPPASTAAHVLLDIAGPYALEQGWVQNSAEGGKSRAAAAIDSLFTDHPAVPPQRLIDALGELGMPTKIAEDYLRTHERLRQIGGVCVRWRGDTVATMIEDLLHALGEPATPQTLFALLEPGAAKLATVKEVLSDGDRFVRASRTTWALRAWNRTVYRGIARAIKDCIDTHGGRVAVDTLTTELVAAYPDISPESIDAYLSTWAFVVRNEIVRRRGRGDSWPKVPDLRTVRGVFCTADDEIRVVIPVDHELLRGSGVRVHRAVAAAASVRPRQQRTFTGPLGRVTLRWDVYSSAGPDIGSLRAYAQASDATSGDSLILTLHPSSRTFTTTRLRYSDPAPVQLRTLLGPAADRPAEAMARALDCEPGEAVKILRRRGDTHWADLISAHSHESLSSR